MTSSVRHDRTVRLLAGRLETIAQAAERTHGSERELELCLLRTATATRNAVRLELITADEADAIWRAAAERHLSVGEPLVPPRAPSSRAVPRSVGWRSRRLVR